MSELLEKLAIELGAAFIAALGDAYRVNTKEDKDRILRCAIAAMREFLAVHNPFYNPTDEEIRAHEENFASARNAIMADVHASMVEVMRGDASLMVKGLVGIMAGGLK